MFCPKCATENGETAQFCRSCGANISLVPQAVAGKLQERDEGREARRARKHGEDITIERAVRSLFMGIAFLFIAFAVKTWAPAGNLWWFWMLLPAAGLLADGVGTHLRLREKRQAAAQLPTAYDASPPGLSSPPRAARLPRPDTGELVPPPSVTENTTRHLATPPKRRPEDA